MAITNKKYSLMCYKCLLYDINVDGYNKVTMSEPNMDGPKTECVCMPFYNGCIFTYSVYCNMLQNCIVSDICQHTVNKKAFTSKQYLSKFWCYKVYC